MQMDLSGAAWSRRIKETEDALLEGVQEPLRAEAAALRGSGYVPGYLEGV
jgi:hypothetical protein